MFKVQYSSIDRYRETRTFKTLAGARAYAVKWVGANPDTCGSYAVSDDGVGKVEVTGATLAELFADPQAAPRQPTDDELQVDWEREQRAIVHEEAQRAGREWAAQVEAMRPRRAHDCTCTDQQLDLVGCDCAASYPF